MTRHRPLGADLGAMRASPFPRSSLWLVAGLAALLIGLAALQWRWIGRWSAVEEARLESALRTGAQDLDQDLSRRLQALQEAFLDLRADDSQAARRVADALRRWQSGIDPPDVVEAVYWVAPGPTPQLERLEGDSLVGLAWPERLGMWRERLRAFPARLQPVPGTTESRLVLDEATFPDLPPALLVPALPAATDPERPLRFVLIELAEDGLREHLLPDLIRRHIVGHALYDIRIASSSGLLYTSRPDLPKGAFTTPDLDRPLGPTERTELVISIDPETRTEEAQFDIAAFQSETRTGGAAGRWRLQVRHRAGSIAAATRTLKLRQLALAFGVLAVLGAATTLLLLSVRRQRQLAQRQLAFVAGVTHELRTPLAVLHAAGENLSDGVVEDPAMARQYGTLVRDESRRLADMVETVLTYAGADATTTRHSPLRAEDWVQAAAAQAQPVLEETQTTLVLDVAPNLPDLDGDPIALATALRNLLANAALHGGSSVHVSARTIGFGSDSAIELAVSDDGPGIHPANREALFEPFVRGETAIERQTPGSGLGLALVKRIVEAHGGTVELATTDKTTFRITLPTNS